MDRWHRETVRALKDPEVRDRLVADGADPVGSTPDEFAALFRDDVERYTRIIRQAGIPRVD